MKVSIKNMVCNRCIMVVTSVFEKHDAKPIHVELGEAETKDEIPPEK